MHMNNEGADRTASATTERAALDRLCALDARAVGDSVALVDRLAPGDLTRPTPCAGWDLAALLGHLTAQHRGFAAAALGRGGDLAHWAVHPVGDDVPAAVAGYRRAAADVRAAFAAVDRPDRPFALPEFTTERTVPAARAIAFHLIDYVVHSWDLARTLDLPYDPDPRLLDAALPIARAVPDGAARQASGSSFRPALPAADGAGPLDRILAMLGRAPDWRAPGR
ncbi:TIGR03086 family metal-binding protein [Streptomyces sp. RS10V-4]|uniref:TIGR03086 family metal-binding protein n=1 Tax=Streptomyces rhizoryzae TaxID=2932493 RepID=UPI0020033355|nr:TIGR03086 family metal-binding protein [Streptomyces rhizoryzae]MCK7627131.1 TIGR03086 family metal-binding protein [Streptomyces rhizoryzae]